PQVSPKRLPFALLLCGVRLEPLHRLVELRGALVDVLLSAAQDARLGREFRRPRLRLALRSLEVPEAGFEVLFLRPELQLLRGESLVSGRQFLRLRAAPLLEHV